MTNNLNDFLNKILLGDSLEYLRQLPSNSIDAVITIRLIVVVVEQLLKKLYHQVKNMNRVQILWCIDQIL